MVAVEAEEQAASSHSAVKGTLSAVHLALARRLDTDLLVAVQPTDDHFVVVTRWPSLRFRSESRRLRLFGDLARQSP